MNFLRKSHIKDVNVDRIDRDDTPAQGLWTPYPIQRKARNSYMSMYFDEACKLSYIARDTAWEMPRALKDVKLKHEVYGRLQEWRRKLPRIFEPRENPAPYILILWFVLPLIFTQFLVCLLMGELPTGCAITH